MKISNAAFAAIGVACLSSAAVAQERSPVTAKLEVADLDLSTPAGQAELGRRILRVSNMVCDNGSRDLDLQRDAQRCRSEMIADGRRQIALRTAKPQVQMAAASESARLPR